MTFPIKKTIILFFILTAYITVTYGRETISYNNDWLFKKGPFPTDSVLFRKSMQSGWQPVNIPHTWNTTDMQTAQNSYYAGEAYYKKTYTPDFALRGKRIFLHFEAVASVAEVYVNSQFAGNHKGGFSAFAIEITRLLKYGEKNEILVKVSNEPRPDVIPVNNALFGVYGGIYRPVSLIITENVNIAVTDYASPGVYISQKNVDRKQAGVNIRVKLENRMHGKQNVRLENLISDASGKVVARQESVIDLSPQGRQFFEQDFVIRNPHLWQGLEDPYLYKLTTQLKQNCKVIDEIIQPLGLRKFELKAGDGMYLNGKKTNMYGVCRHQDWWQSGSALSNEQHDTDLAIIRELGATTIRLAHYQQSEYFYAKCDSIGFMVWAEIPFVRKVTTKEEDNAKQQLIELIRQNYNHPAIYVWGMHNEVYNPINYTAALTTELNDLAKSEDPYRYTVSVNGYGNPGHGVNMNADIQGINRYYGWYENKIQDLEPWIEETEKNYPDYKIMLSEYGAEANIFQQQEAVSDTGDCCGPGKNYNESFATRFHEIQWGYIAKHPYLLASYLWNTFDFATPESYQGGIPARNMKGLVTFDRKTKKDPFYWYKANWSKEPVLYITQRRVVERENQITPVTVYSNIGTPKLYVNGKEITAFKTGTTAVHYIFENVELQEGKNEITVKAIKNGIQYEDKIYWTYSKDHQPLNAQCSIIPAPQQVTLGNGYFSINDKTQMVCADPKMKAEAGKLQKYIFAATGKNVPIVGTGTNNAIILETFSGMEGSEAYQLSVESNKIICRAATPAGMFYAGQSLMQMLGAGGKLPCLSITDKPQHEWRGMMLDESRHFFGKDVVKQYLDIMARLKLNRFHWHLTDEPGWRIEIKRYPKLTEIGADGNWSDHNAPRQFYTQDDIREIVAYAAERHIMVIPEIDMPGHASAVTRAYPEVSAGGSGRWAGFTFHPAKEETYEFIKNILTEVAGLFPGPYIHVGGDEVHYGNQTWFTDPEIQKFIKDHQLVNEAGLEHYFVRRACEMVNNLGKTMIGWDEIIASGVSPGKAIVMWWRHDKPEQLSQALDMGFHVILCPRIPCYLDFVQDETHKIGRRWGQAFASLPSVYEFPKEIQPLIAGRDQQILGMQVNIWTERVADKKRLDFMLFPRTVAIAESAWSNTSVKNETGFEERLKVFLKYLDGLNIYYFNPFDKESSPDPYGPETPDWYNRPEYQSSM